MAGPAQDPVLGAIYGNGGGAPVAGNADPVLGAIYGGGHAAAPLVATPAGAPNVGLKNAPAPKGKGGGGVLGFIGKELGTAKNMVTGVPKGLAQLGKDVGTAAARGGENLANDVMYGVTRATTPLGGESLGGAQDFHLGGVSGTPNFTTTGFDAHGHPTGTVGGISVLPSERAVAERVATSYPALQAARAGLKTSGVHAQGAFELPALAINKALGRNNAPLTGAASKTVHDYAKDPLGAAVNDAASLTMVAGGAGDVAKLAGADDLAGALHAVHSVAGSVAGAPMEPWLRAAGAGGGLLAHIAPGLVDAVNNMRGQTAVNQAAREGAVRPTDISALNEKTLAAVPGSKDEFAAGVLRAQGLHQVLEPLASDPLLKPAYDATLARLGARGDVPSDAAVQLALHPNDNVTAAENAMREISAQRQARALNGFGTASGQAPLAEAQTRAEPMQDAVNSMVQKEMKARDTAVAQLRALPPDATDAERNFARYAVQKTTNALESADAAAREDKNANPAFLRTPVEIARRAIEDLTAKTKTGFRNSAEVPAEGAPEPRQAFAAFRQQAENAAMQRAAAQLEPLSHYSTWHEMPEDQLPAHIIGDTTEETARGARGAGARQGKEVTTAAGHLREGQATAYSKDGQLALENRELAKAARNEGLKRLSAAHSVTPRQLLGDQVDSMTGPQIHDMTQTALAGEHGVQYDPWNPSAKQATTLGVDAKNVTGDTPYIPHPIYNALDKRFPNEENIGVADWTSAKATKALDVATRYGYRNFLGLEPGYVARRLVGNTGILAVNGVPFKEIPGRVADAMKAIHNDEDPAALSRNLNSETSTVGGRVSKVMQGAPRYVDLVAREVLYQHFREQGMDYEQAVAKAQAASGDSGSALEKNVLQRAVPGFSWGKTVGKAGLDLAAEHPAAALEAANLGRIGNQKGSGFTAGGGALGLLNPLSIFTMGGGAINPVVRGVIGAATGFNPTTMKDVTRPLVGTRPGPLTPEERTYFALNQLPGFKLYEQSPFSQQNQDYGHYQTGELETSGSKALPAYVPPSKTPLGKFGSAWAQAAGFPSSPKANAAGKVAQAKIKASATKSRAKDAAIRKALAKKGIR